MNSSASGDAKVGENGVHMDGVSAEASAPILSSVRFQIGLLLCNCFVVLSIMRSSLSMSMVCMVNATAIHARIMSNDNETIDDVSNATLLQKQTKSTCEQIDVVDLGYEGEFEWDSETQGMIFAAIMVGSLVGTLPIGVLADRYGSKKILAGTFSICAVAAFISPFGAKLHYIALAIIRFIIGIAVGFIIPCSAAIVARWVPPEERSRFMALSSSGNQIGTIISYPVFAWLCSIRNILGGWPLIFYVAAAYSLIMFIFWMLLMTNSPTKHRKISTQELDFLRISLPHQHESMRKSTVMPWLSILTSKPVWACIIANFAAGLHVHIMGTYLPTYLKDVLYFNLKSNGLLSMMPYICLFVLKFTWSYAADYLLKRKAFSQSVICKASQSLSSFGMALFIVLCSLLSCEHGYIAVILLCLSNGFCAGQTPGFITSFVCIAPNHAGTVRSLGSVASLIAGATCPYLVGWIAVEGTKEEWQIVFAINAVILTLSGIFFIIYGSATPQEWSKAAPKKVSSIVHCDNEELIASDKTRIP